MAKYRVKLCGVCRAEDARMAGELGADFVGLLIDGPHTVRGLTLERAQTVAAAASAPIVLLLWEPEVERAAELTQAIRPHAIQLLADETPDDLKAIKEACGCEVWKAVHLPARGTGEVDTAAVLAQIAAFGDAGADAIVLDAKAVIDGRERRGGTGQASDWSVAAEIVRQSPLPTFLAGGINADNVTTAIQTVRPHGVDLASGAESEKGKKDPEKVRRIVEHVRRLEWA